MNPMFYFLLALTSVLAASTDAQLVLDTDGDFISGGSYYVLPAIFGPAGGLALAGRGGKPCPLDIVQLQSEVEMGIPVIFSNWKPKIAFVLENQDLNIMTDIAATICVQSTYWWIGEFDEKRKQSFVVAGPKPKDFEKDSLKSFFQIKKAEFANSYKFVFCPEDDCTDVGIFTDEKGVRRLALSSEPFSFVFVKSEKIKMITSKTI